jgi:hypothetical protein
LTNVNSRRFKIKHNYLNNKDILKEIHKSKNTYCSYSSPDFCDYDIILPDIKKLNKTNILQGRKNRAERLAKLAHELATADGTKRKLDEFEIDVKDVAATDVVFRVMSWEHVPFDDSKKGKKVLAYVDEDEPVSEYDDEEEVKTTKYTKCNFPPFQHYKIDDANEPYIVGKSHWRGALDTGEYSKDHGAMTKKLAHMFMKLCERYATRSNWRGYTYNDEMRSQALLQLSQIGLQFDESKSQNPFAYYTAAITNSFTRVLNIEKRNQNLRDDILEMNNLNPSYTRQGMGGMGGGGGSYDGDE